MRELNLDIIVITSSLNGSHEGQCWPARWKEGSCYLVSVYLGELRSFLTEGNTLKLQTILAKTRQKNRGKKRWSEQAPWERGTNCVLVLCLCTPVWKVFVKKCVHGCVFAYMCVCWLSDFYCGESKAAARIWLTLQSPPTLWSSIHH